jgi:uncharacterized protein YjdB
MKKWLFVLLLAFGLTWLVACEKEPVVPITYTVTFDTGEGGTTIPSQVITNGGKVTKPSDPTRDGFVFTDVWMNGTFEWDFDLDIVTEDLTLVAGWLEISSTPIEIKMIDEPFTSTVEWRQTDANLQNFTVSIRPEDSATYTVIEGSFVFDTTDLMQIVHFTPTVLPSGGTYVIKIEVSGNVVESDPLLFGGGGTEENPYLVNNIGDVLLILENEEYQDDHYLQTTDLLSTVTEPIEINDDRKASFSGTYDGGNFTISFTGSGGLFHEILETGVVRNLVIDGTTTLYAAELNLYPIGAVADFNAGLIENVTSRALLENARLQGSLPVYDGVDTTDLTTGAGGIVGLNQATGIIREVNVGGSGAIKAGRGIGGVAAYNFGLIEHVIVTATLPAGNQANTARSSNTYSYGGGVAGFNFGTIQYAAVSGRVFAQSAFADAGAGNEGKNVAFGGIAGYNEGIIRDSSFARSLAAKEFIDKARATELDDLANNLGVASIHGDLYIGGIAGINAGDIYDVYVGGALIAARDFAGGIAGLTLGTGMISNAYVFAEVTTKDDGGLVTVAGPKTTATTYEIAPSGFDANTTLFKRLINSETNLTWVPGDVPSPKLPEFTTDDLAKVGNHFNASGVLNWQSGAVTAVNIVLENIVLPFGASAQLEYSITPSTAPDLYTEWTSSNDLIVVAHPDGLIEGIGVGTAVITVTTRDGGFTDTISVTVEDYVHVDSVTVTSPEITLPEPNNIEVRPEINIGTVINFEVVILPENAEYTNYTLTASNSRAVINGNEVTFVYGNTGPGNVSIVVSFEDSSVGSLEYRFKTVEVVVDIPITGVTITSPEITLPEANNSEVRPEIEIGTVINLVVDILPIEASNKNYTITSSNSRAEVNGHEVTFVYGLTGPGNVSINVLFEDTSVGVNGLFEFRFLTVEPANVPITSVLVTSPEVTMPEVNNIEVRPTIEIGTVINLVVEILPANATNKNYTITSSNSRAVVDGHQVSFVYGLTGPGSVSIRLQFEDTSVGIAGLLEYRFSTIEVVADIPITSVTVTSPEFTMPEVNNIAVRPTIDIGTVINLVVEILPADATNKNYTITSSNSRAVVDGHQVSFVYGLTGPGSVSIKLQFEDTSVGIGGLLEYRFSTVQPPVTISANITSADITLGTPNVIDSKALIQINTTIGFTVTFTPENPTNMNYTMTASNGRATVNPDQTVTFNLSTGVGNVSITFTFEDTTISPVIFYFTTTE